MHNLSNSLHYRFGGMPFWRTFGLTEPAFFSTPVTAMLATHHYPGTPWRLTTTFGCHWPTHGGFSPSWAFCYLLCSTATVYFTGFSDTTNVVANNRASAQQEGAQQSCRPKVRQSKVQASTPPPATSQKQATQTLATASQSSSHQANGTSTACPATAPCMYYIGTLAHQSVKQQQHQQQQPGSH